MRIVQGASCVSVSFNEIDLDLNLIILQTHL